MEKLNHRVPVCEFCHCDIASQQITAYYAAEFVIKNGCPHKLAASLVEYLEHEVGDTHWCERQAINIMRVNS